MIPVSRVHTLLPDALGGLGSTNTLIIGFLRIEKTVHIRVFSTFKSSPGFGHTFISFISNNLII